MTIQPSVRTQCNNKRSRIPYSRYSGIVSLEQEPESELTDTKPTTSDSDTRSSSPPQSPPIDNAWVGPEFGHQYPFGASGHRPYKGHSGESPNLEQERRNQMDVRDEQGRSVSPVLEQTRWLSEQENL